MSIYQSVNWNKIWCGYTKLWLALGGCIYSTIVPTYLARPSSTGCRRGEWREFFKIRKYVANTICSTSVCWKQTHTHKQTVSKLVRMCWQRMSEQALTSFVFSPCFLWPLSLSNPVPVLSLPLNLWVRINSVITLTVIQHTHTFLCFRVSCDPFSSHWKIIGSSTLLFLSTPSSPLSTCITHWFRHTV